MRILYVTDAFTIWGGLERVLADKINYLIEHDGYEVCLLTVNQGTHSMPYILHPNVQQMDLGIQMHQQYNYHSIKRLLKRRELKKLLVFKLMEAIDKFSPDIIICVKLDFVGVLLAVKGTVPLVVECHTLCKSDALEGSGLLRRLHSIYWKLLLRKANAVVALTEGDAAAWKRWNRNVFVIPNVVNLNNHSSVSDCRNNSAIFVGRFSMQKDIDNLLRIWGLVSEKYPEWQLDIYGDGELREHYLPMINEMGANVRVFAPIADIMEKYRGNSILLLTSLYEPFGLVLPEAMSCGLPVVAFDCPYGPADIITDGVDGFLVGNRSIETFAQRVCQLIESDDLRRQMGQAGMLSSQRYQVERIMPLWKELFENLVFSRA